MLNAYESKNKLTCKEGLIRVHINMPWKAWLCLKHYGMRSKVKPPLSYAVSHLIDKLHAKFTWAPDLPFHISLRLFSSLLFFSPPPIFLRAGETWGGPDPGWNRFRLWPALRGWGSQGNKGHSGKPLWAGRAPSADNTAANVLEFAQSTTPDSVIGWGEVCVCLHSVKEKEKQTDRWANKTH